MGTIWPSGRVAVVGAAVKLTACCPTEGLTPRRRRRVSGAAIFKLDLTKWDSIFFSWLERLINDELPEINQHHHQHAARENIVGGNFALVMRVPHERKARFRRRVIRDRAGRRSCTGSSASG